MKKLLLLATLALFWLSACAVTQPVSATETSVAAAISTPATPATGFVTVHKFEKMEALLLRSQPDPKSALAGQVLPGETGKVLGFNVDGTWALLKFADQSGWAPVVALDLTIAE